MRRHKKIHNINPSKPPNRYKCPHCTATYTTRYKLKKHIQSKHKDKISELSPPQGPTNPEIDFSDLDENIEVQSTFDNTAYTITIKLDDSDEIVEDLNLTLFANVDISVQIISRCLSAGYSVHYYYYVEALLAKYDEQGGFKNEIDNTPETRVVAKFRSEREVLTSDTPQNLPEFGTRASVQKSIMNIVTQLDNYQQDGSGWYMHNVKLLQLNLALTNPLLGGCSFFLPTELARKSNCFVDPPDDGGQKCFLYAVIAYMAYFYELCFDETLYTKLEFYREREEQYNCSNMNYPVGNGGINTFENDNPSVAVVVFKCMKRKKQLTYYPHRQSPFKNERPYIVNLLLINNHYMAILNKSGLFASSISKRNLKMYFCDRCMYSCHDQDVLNYHETLCESGEWEGNHLHMPRESMPAQANSILKFTKMAATVPSIYQIIYDFESVLTVFQGCKPPPNLSWNYKTQVHEAISFCYVIIDSEGRMVGLPQYYSGPDAAEVLVVRLQEEAERLLSYISKPLEHLTEEEQSRKDETRACEICGTNFYDEDGEIVLSKYSDHCHHSGGGLRFVLCNGCNLHLKEQRKSIPAVAHNATNYDNFHLLKAIFARYNPKSDYFRAVPKTVTKFTEFRYNQVVYKDSFNFLRNSLDQLVKTLEPHEFGVFNSYFSSLTPLQRDLLRQKGFFCYEYITSPDVLKESCLPPREEFYSSLTGQTISEDEYAHALRVYEVMGCQTIADYLRLYNICDSILLALVWSKYCTANFKNYKICPSHFMSGAHLYYNACLLKMKDERIELMTDYDQFLIIRANIRGGLAGAFLRGHSANNPLLDHFDESKPISYISMWDYNSLYASAQYSFQYPTGDYQTLSEPETFDLALIQHDSDTGYLLCVDLAYPTEIKEETRHLPLCPSNEIITYDQLSPYNKAYLKQFNLKYPKKVRKLVASQNDKNKILLHGEALMFYLSRGMQLKKIHTVISFKQSFWLKKWVAFNNQLRQDAKTTIEGNCAKAATNYTYGAFGLQKSKYNKLEVVTSADKFEQNLQRKNVTNWHILRDDLMLMTYRPKKVVLDRPLIVSFITLECARVLFYTMYYERLRPIYGPSLTLAYCDTDSYLMTCTDPQFYEKLGQIKEYLDTSNYPQDHPLFDPSGRQKLNKIKDEHGGKPIAVIYCIRSKVYFVRLGNGQVTKKLKGYPRSALKQLIHDEHFKQCLTEPTRLRHTYTKIDAEGFQLFTKHYNKISLANFDDKMWVISDSEVEPYGYRKY